MKYKDIVDSVRLKEQLTTTVGAEMVRGRKQLAHRNKEEAELVKMIDEKDAVLSLNKEIRKLSNTNDVQSFLTEISPTMAIELALLAKASDSEKIKLEAIKDILDRAGFGKVTKHAVARFDANSSKEQILAAIMGARKDLSKAGIEIVDDDEDQEK